MRWFDGIINSMDMTLSKFRETVKDMRLTREEAFAIRYHMGFSGNEPAGNVGSAFEMFPLAFALSTADMEATYFLEGKN